jgi:hypothetical protein
VVRASIAAEKVGIPSASIITSGFLKQSQAVGQSLGVQNLPLAEYPGVVALDSREELDRKVAGTLVDNIIQAFTNPVLQTTKPREPEPDDVVFRGTLDEIQEFFARRQWTDGLPVIPPTITRVERFLRFTDRPSKEVIGILLPENREATVWNIAANGVMAGCRPEYMPVLLAVIEAIADPEFRIEDAGSTPGWEPLIILNGPIIKELNFNCEGGVMRVGRQANTSIGRFLRLFMRNVAGLRIPPGTTDKGTIADTFNVVLAENEDVLAELGWESFSVARGFKPHENVVTVQSVVFTTAPIASGGDKPQDHLDTFVEVFGGTMATWTHMAVNWGKFYPLLVINPSSARMFAHNGLQKKDIKQYLYDNSKVPVRLIETLAWQDGLTGFNLRRMVEDNLISKRYYESDDPGRMVPVFLRSEWIGIVISGDSGRNRSRGYVQNHEQGPPVSKKIQLPSNWERILQAK